MKVLGEAATQVCCYGGKSGVVEAETGSSKGSTTALWCVDVGSSSHARALKIGGKGKRKPRVLRPGPAPAFSALLLVLVLFLFLVLVLAGSLRLGARASVGGRSAAGRQRGGVVSERIRLEVCKRQRSGGSGHGRTEPDTALVLPSRRFRTASHLPMSVRPVSGLSRTDASSPSSSSSPQSAMLAGGMHCSRNRSSSSSSVSMFSGGQRSSPLSTSLSSVGSTTMEGRRSFWGSCRALPRAASGLGTSAGSGKTWGQDVRVRAARV